ncbi:MAG: type II secretion system protein [Gemmataceae bacterium]
MVRTSLAVKFAPRRGFTLIEVLVVIAIIAVLASLTIVVASRVRGKGQELEVRSDISQMTTAIGAFRSKFNAPIATAGGGLNSTFRLASAYQNASGAYYSGFNDNSPEIVYLKQLFPRMDLRDNGLRRNAVAATTTNLTTDGILGSAPLLMDGNQMFVILMSGGSFTEYNGFASNPGQPFLSTGTRVGGMPFIEVKANKLVTPASYSKTSAEDGFAFSGDRFTNDTADSKAQPWYTDSWKNPYLFFAPTADNVYPTYTSTTGYQVGPWGGANSPNSDGVFPFRQSNTKFLNPRGIQIISAGRDGKMGPGSRWTAANTYNIYKAAGTDYAPTDNGADDMSNFASGILSAE